MGTGRVSCSSALSIRRRAPTSIAWRMFISPARPATVTDTLTTGSFDRSDTASLQRLAGSFAADTCRSNRVAPLGWICDTERISPSKRPSPTSTVTAAPIASFFQHEAEATPAFAGADFGGLAVAVCLSSGTNDELQLVGRVRCSMSTEDRRASR